MQHQIPIDPLGQVSTDRYHWPQCVRMLLYTKLAQDFYDGLQLSVGRFFQFYTLTTFVCVIEREGDGDGGGGRNIELKNIDREKA